VYVPSLYAPEPDGLAALGVEAVLVVEDALGVLPGWFEAVGKTAAAFE
jgi:hypothetical protein